MAQWVKQHLASVGIEVDELLRLEHLIVDLQGLGDVAEGIRGLDEQEPVRVVGIVSGYVAKGILYPIRKAKLRNGLIKLPHPWSPPIALFIHIATRYHLITQALGRILIRYLQLIKNDRLCMRRKGLGVHISKSQRLCGGSGDVIVPFPGKQLGIDAGVKR